MSGSFPPIEKTMEGLLKQFDRRMTFVERRLAVSGVDEALTARVTTLETRLDAAEARLDVLETVLPDALFAAGPSASSVTTAASTWADATGVAALTMGPYTRDLLSRIDYSIQAASTSSTTYVRVGAQVTGDVTLGEDEANGFAPDPLVPVTNASWAPFTFNDLQVHLAESKPLYLPAGQTVTVKMRQYRSGATGTQTFNYAMIRVIPIGWR